MQFQIDTNEGIYAMSGKKTGAVIFLTHFFTAILPVILLTIAAFKTAGNALVFIIISFILALAGLVVHFSVFSGISKGHQALIEAFRQAKNGNLNVKIREDKFLPVRDLIKESSDLINIFNHVLSNVGRSTEEAKHLVNTVKSASKEASEVSNQIAASSEIVSRGAIEQAEDAEQSSMVTMELVNRFEQVAASADLMTKKANITKEMAMSGKSHITDLLEKSKETEKTMEDINSKIGQLNEMAASINNITATIAGIANQTNLLSLNASIEAARAGEMGKGFGVVADEIKKLSQQSFASSEEIKKIILGIQEQVDITTKTIALTTETIHAQNESVHKTNEAFIGISNAVDELFAQLLDVKKKISVLNEFKQTLSDSIDNIASVAQETAASTEEITSLMYSQINSAEILVQLSDSFDSVISSLEEAINKFKYEKISAKKRSFAVIPCYDIPFYYDTRDGAIDAAAKLGVDVIWLASKERDPNEQAALINKVIDQGVDGIGIAPLNSPVVKQSIKKALDNGIKVIYYDTDISDLKSNGFIGTDNYNAGKTLGELVRKKTNGKGRILLTNLRDTAQNLKERMDGFMDVISKYPELEVNIKLTESSGINERWQEIKKAIQYDPKFDCFVCLDSVGSFMVRKMKEELGMTPLSVVFDKTDDSRIPLETGNTYVLAQRQRLWGELVVRRLNEVCNGKTIQDKEDTGTYEINRNNMSVFFK